MANVNKVIDDISQILILKYDKQKKAAWGMHRGYMLLVEGLYENNQNYISISMCASFSGAPVQQVLMHSVRVADKVNCSSAGYRMNLRYAVSGKHDKNVDKAVDSVRALVDFVITNEGVNCDEKGMQGTVEIWSFQGKRVFLCPESAEGLSFNLNKAAAANAGIKENFVLGIVGAIIGSLVGMVVVLLVARLGYISALASALMGFAVVFGYKKLGKKMSILGGVICAVIAIVMTYVAFRIDCAWNLYDVFQEAKGFYERTFMECVKETKEWYERLDAMDDYRHNLIMMMLAGVIGAIGAPLTEYKNQIEQYDMGKLS